jgi:hypothetical protein
MVTGGAVITSVTSRLRQRDCDLSRRRSHLRVVGLRCSSRSIVSPMSVQDTMPIATLNRSTIGTALI